MTAAAVGEADRARARIGAPFEHEQEFPPPATPTAGDQRAATAGGGCPACGTVTAQRMAERLVSGPHTEASSPRLSLSRSGGPPATGVAASSIWDLDQSAWLVLMKLLEPPSELVVRLVGQQEAAGWVGVAFGETLPGRALVADHRVKDDIGTCGSG